MSRKSRFRASNCESDMWELLPLADVSCSWDWSSWTSPSSSRRTCSTRRSTPGSGRRSPERSDSWYTSSVGNRGRSRLQMKVDVTCFFSLWRIETGRGFINQRLHFMLFSLFCFKVLRGKRNRTKLDGCFRKWKQSCLPPYITGWNEIFLWRKVKSWIRAITEGDEYPMCNMGKRVILFNGSEQYWIGKGVRYWTQIHVQHLNAITWTLGVCVSCKLKCS